jgi:ECF transporter S component (folate family)
MVRTQKKISIQVLVSAAFLAAMSVVFGKLLAVNVTQMIRISFENLPIILAGILFGPVIGALVGGIADMVGCVLVGYTINPIITAGACCIGLIAGLVYRFPGLCKRKKIRCFTAVLSAHLVGSMVIKSVGLYLAYDYPPVFFVIRVFVYIGIGIAEGIILYLLLKTEAVRKIVGGDLL